MPGDSWRCDQFLTIHIFANVDSVQPTSTQVAGPNGSSAQHMLGAPGAPRAAEAIAVVGEAAAELFQPYYGHVMPLNDVPAKGTPWCPIQKGADQYSRRPGWVTLSMWEMSSVLVGFSKCPR